MDLSATPVATACRALTLLRKGTLRPKDFAQTLQGRGFTRPKTSSSWTQWAKTTFPGLRVTGEGQDKRLSLRPP